jgi:hypothetical protein
MCFDWWRKFRYCFLGSSKFREIFIWNHFRKRHDRERRGLISIIFSRTFDDHFHPLSLSLPLPLSLSLTQYVCLLSSLSLSLTSLFSSFSSSLYFSGKDTHTQFCLTNKCVCLFLFFLRCHTHTLTQIRAHTDIDTLTLSHWNITNTTHTNMIHTQT